MDNHSGDSSSADGDHPPSVTAPFGDDSSPPPPAPAPAPVSGRAKFMVSYGGRILPKPHDNQLSYIGGETKILAVDRSARFAAVFARLASMCGVEDLCVKYQLPGEDLDALISVTNDEDLEHMMLEYDRLQVLNCSASQRSSGGGAPAKPVTARLRLFLFPIGPPPPLPSAALLEAAAAALPAKPDPRWFVDALNAIPPPPPSAQLEAAQAKAAPPGPDFLFGFDEGFVPPPAVKVKDSTPEASPVASDHLLVETAPPPTKPEHSEERVTEPVAVASAAEIQRQVQDLQKLQIAENHHLQQQQQTQAMHRNPSDEALARAYPPPPEYYPPRTQEKHHPTPTPAYWPDSHAVPATGARFASIAANGDHPVYLIPYPGASPAGQAYYAALPRMVHASQLYAMAPPPPSSSPPLPQKVIGHQFPEGAATGGAPYAAAAYNGAGHPVYYAGAVPTYQTVGGMVLANPTDAVKTSAPAVKPSQAS